MSAADGPPHNRSKARERRDPSSRRNLAVAGVVVGGLYLLGLAAGVIALDGAAAEAPPLGLVLFGGPAIGVLVAVALLAWSPGSLRTAGVTLGCLLVLGVALVESTIIVGGPSVAILVGVALMVGGHPSWRILGGILIAAPLVVLLCVLFAKSRDDWGGWDAVVVILGVFGTITVLLLLGVVVLALDLTRGTGRRRRRRTVHGRPPSASR